MPWWTLRDDKLVGRVNTPLTSSRDEWAESFMDLAKLLVEGFETKPIRVRLDQAQVPHTQDDKTIVLLEKLLNKDAHKGVMAEAGRPRSINFFTYSL